ncbi:MAG: DUF1846 domain-containing protein [Oscillospiraceae bacterium]
MTNRGFDNEKYVKLQSQKIRERIAQFGGKLYLEFGGKLFDDYHAARVLHGFAPDGKVNMLLQLRDAVEIVIAINAFDIEKSKIRGDLGITYDLDVLRLIDAFSDIGLFVGSVVLTRFSEQPTAIAFQKKLEQLGVKVYRHYPIEGYPSDVGTIVSDEGYGKNEYIETSRSLVVVTAPGPGSGKMATCLSQLYHDYKSGNKAGYAKFETFPIWNMPLMHPVNLAYEAATADLNDVNLIDPFHLDAYGETAVSYNRDVEVYPVLREIFEQIQGECPYKSPTDMGVNMIGFCITDDAAVRRSSCDEIVRRYYDARVKLRRGEGDVAEVRKIELLMRRENITPQLRPVVGEALKKEQETSAPAVAIELPDGRIVTGKTSSLLGACAAAMLNALKALGGIQDDIHLISPVIIEPIQDLKINHLGNRNPRLHTDEILIALSICAATNPTAEIAMQQLSKLRCCEIHSTVILSSVDTKVFRRLGMNLTSEPNFESKKLYHK